MDDVLIDSLMIVSGVGEYLDLTSPYYNLNNTSSNDSFSIVSNAILVHNASIQVIAAACMVVITDQRLRETIGENARKYVNRYFRLYRQTVSYGILYQKLVWGQVRYEDN